MIRRRSFLGSAAVGLAPLNAAAAPAPIASGAAQETLPLNGVWRFRIGSEKEFRKVEVPHTWQVQEATAEHYGAAVYERDFDVPAAWRGKVLRIEFEAVFHSARVAVNGTPAGEHLRKGYTAFWLDVTALVKFGGRNHIQVDVTNAFDEEMLPRGRSSDWAHDGGIYRPVWLHATPATHAERVEINAEPGVSQGAATVAAKIVVAGGTAATKMLWRIVEEAGGWVAAEGTGLAAGGIATRVEQPLLWHFDHPHLYRLEVELDSGHRYSETFGIRKFTVRNREFYLNGEKVKLMGAERMAGSHPTYGMAEPREWIDHDHADMRELNCVYTRVHWPQDKRTLDYCDRHGIMIQTEVPTWGPRTFAGMTAEPSDTIMQNGLGQLREMIARDRNHPSICSWGVCNEIGGQNPPAYRFAKRMYDEAKKLDPHRLVTYASHSLTKTPEKDVSREMDFIMWNQYYESWLGGTQADLARNLDDIGRAFPDKAIVVSEYGYCACTLERPEGDARRIEILRDHSRILRERPFVAGLIFFCYNDYRTHVGDKGVGILKQRVHGVVDLYGRRKESFAVLRDESSPVEWLRVRMVKPGEFHVTLKCRDSVPAHPLKGYTVEAVAVGPGEVPVEVKRKQLATLQPGQEAEIEMKFASAVILSLRVDVLRPTLDSARTHVWRA
ncbi:MAG TPA: glycoside hydrolase family 2 TIM barrel-domain containing protein [Bryobacteraceae bacterium]|nr:glycoside hydrolase family 2 TIM barrel-domain containing protein [Bryobacteraceae bacterium]